jgi:RNA polymerase sigma-70 factor (ECF subfamily)
MSGTTAPPAADSVLSELARDLDRGFVELFDAYHQLVFSSALRISGRWADAEDITAEAFLRAYRALRGYDRERIVALQPRAWLVTILLNVWRNHRRSAARRPRPAPLDQAPDAPDPAPGVEQVVEGHETGRELAGLLAQLPERQRVSIVLRYVSDLPIAEIAAVLGCPEGTVKSHISRGLRRLRELHANLGSQAPTSLAGGTS